MSSLPHALLLDLVNKTSAALRALFAQLGYTPVSGISYSGRTLDWPDNVAAELNGRVFELLASLDDTAFQVLLLPPHPETGGGLSLALQRRLHRTLDERLGEGLLVLPNQAWDLFELVLLVDTRTAEERAADAPLYFPRFSFDPRALLPHHQRALELMDAGGVSGAEAGQHLQRAFGRAQQETLFRSQNFFSRHYLERRIADDGQGIGEAWAALLENTADVRAAADADDLQPRPILAALGWELFSTGTGGLFTLRGDGSDAALLAILPANAPIEQAVAGQDYPQLALIAALEQEKKHKQHGIAWGILTNGRVWRLYSTLPSSISGVYYEVDLRDLLQFGDDADLRFFSGFFGAAGLASAFARKVFYASQTLAKQVGENLKKTIFDQVFEELATGIAHDLWRRGQYTGDEAQRKLIFRATLVLLYRVLFLLYAESRRLLPTMHPAYYPHSLTRLLTDIAIQPFLEDHKKRPLGPTAFWAWEWLRDLCKAVDQGRSDWGVPRYNGGLFSNGKKTNDLQPTTSDEETIADDPTAPHRLLEQVSIGALYLYKALDLLGRQKPEPGEPLTIETARRLIDYAALDVRRLGSIYEGLLEYQLEQVGVAQDGSPALKLPRTYQGRKASGSYYTPDYIVAYIVEQAVGPVLQEREQRFDELMGALAAARTALRREEDKFKNERISFDTIRANVEAARRQVEALEHQASETLLDLKVLDPAMGSGHFLVETVDFLSDRLIAILQRHRDNPIRARLEAIRADIRASLQEQGVDQFIGDEQLSDPRLLRRLVMKRCVYGVDLNDMAVELARLSLWLHSFTVGAPLSFLDHHLKWGNSLIGARAREVQASLEGAKTGKKDAEGDAFQYDLFGHGSAFREMLNLAGLIEELVQIADANGQQVEQSAALYAAFESKVIDVKRLLDLWVSQHFGSKEAANLVKLYSGSQGDVAELVDALMGRRTLDRDGQKAVDRALTLFRQHRFLHWDLEFPEVFIDLHSRAWKDPDKAGFDAVVGNPPYDEISEYAWGRSTAESGYLEAQEEYKPSLGGRPNLFRFFILRALSLTRGEGSQSFIVPLPLLTDRFSEGTRKLIISDYQFSEIHCFPQKDDPNNRVFEGAKLSTCIYSLRKQRSNGNFKVYVYAGRYFEDGFQYEIKQEKISIIDPVGAAIPLATSFGWKLLEKLSYQDKYTNFGKFADIYPGEIMLNAQFSQFVSNEITSDLLLRGAHIGRYLFNNNPKQGTPVYLKKQLYLKDRKNDTKSQHHLYLRIGFQRGAAIDNWRRLIATILEPGVFLTDTVGYILVKKPFSIHFTLAVFNSQLLEWRFGLFSTTNHVNAYEVRSLPIRRIAFTTPEAERAALVAEARGLYEQRLQGTGDRGQEPGDWRAWREHWLALWEWADARLPGDGGEGETGRGGDKERGEGETRDTRRETWDTRHETRDARRETREGQTRDDTGSPSSVPLAEQSDAVHDLLAFLAERMIDLNKQKQAEARRFSEWLEGETGTRIDGWKNKTTVQEFWEKDWDAMYRALQQNRGAFMQTQGLKGKNADAALEPLARAARARWEQGRAALAPILAAIAATDRLIDLLVYRLYGLTDEEIDLVEGG